MPTPTPGREPLPARAVEPHDATIESSVGAAAETKSALSRWVTDIAELTRARLSALVLIATGAGYLIALGEQFLLDTDRFGARILQLIATIAGTSFVAAAASVFNQVMERDADRRMRRTSVRPLATGRMGPGAGLTIGVLLTVAGLSILCGTSNSLAALLSLASLVIYLAVYTPLKKVSSLNTLVGAIPGAIPPLIGWAAATGQLGPGAWVLFAIVFVWQIPHFLAIAWLYRDQYAAAGFQMLTHGDAAGTRTGRMAVFYSMCLIPATLTAPLVGLGGPGYAIGSLLAGVAFLVVSVAFLLRPSERTARRLFFASIAYLPVIFGILIIGV